LRPALVFMRARKPCLLLRLRFRGRYVGFMSNHLATRKTSRKEQEKISPPPCRVNGLDPKDPDAEKAYGKRGELTFPHPPPSLAGPSSKGSRPRPPAHPEPRRRTLRSPPRTPVTAWS
jgi:hypothetical protein